MVTLCCYCVFKNILFVMEDHCNDGIGYVMEDHCKVMLWKITAMMG